MEEAPPDVKRRRISAAGSSPRGIRCLTDLPSGILAHAASFLAAPSKALFAVALDGNSAVSPNERSSAIVSSNQWSILDFGEIEKELAIKLNDDDIEKVLLCIDAVNSVKRLKLTNCIHIAGAGLEPLRGSIIIEQIDLSLVGEHQNPNINPEPPISCNHAIPTLDSIIEREGCALRHLQFPQVWREEPSTDSEFHQFLLRYNQMLTNREHVGCLECNQRLPSDGNEWIETGTNAYLHIWYGTQAHNCYDCFKHYCYDCKIDFCWTCQTDYCEDCTKMSDCKSCENSHCNDCYEHECHECNEKICLDCVEREYNCHKCGDCDKVLCSECIEDEDVKTDVYTCDQCNDSCCDVCRLRKFRQGQLGCTDCIKQVASLLECESKECVKRLNC